MLVFMSLCDNIELTDVEGIGSNYFWYLTFKMFIFTNYIYINRIEYNKLLFVYKVWWINLDNQNFSVLLETYLFIWMDYSVERER